jgi:uncharacterized protein YeaO (DUF488 family)
LGVPEELQATSGHIVLCSIRRLVQADVRLFIARIPPARLPQGWVHVPQLAPSTELFYQYRGWARTGQWPAMWPEYERRFKEEMPAMRRFLDRVEEHLQAGRSVALACYCEYSRHCHRGILGEYFHAKGYPVVW